MKQDDNALRQNGAALAELLVAVAIISTAIVSILALLAVSLEQAQFSRAQFIASMLAIEGIEVVHAIRDENWINGRPWNAGLAPGDYQVQYNSTSLVPFSGNPLRFDSISRHYQYDTGENTEFTRRIIISSVSANEIRIISNVRWRVRNIPNPFEINTEAHLFNWLQ
jgi:Tfp pilus assembly protein PilV